MDRKSKTEGETTESVHPVLAGAKSDLHMQERGNSWFAA
jgi:hypothetical protein